MYKKETEEFLQLCVTHTLREPSSRPDRTSWFATSDAGTWFLQSCRATLRDSERKMLHKTMPTLSQLGYDVDGTARSIVQIFSKTASSTDAVKQFPHSFVLALVVTMLCRYQRTEPHLARDLLSCIASHLQHDPSHRAWPSTIEHEYLVLHPPAQSSAVRKSWLCCLMPTSE